MDDTTRWIMIALLLLLIGAAVFMLLRSPGKESRGDTLDRTDGGRDGLTTTDGDRTDGDRTDDAYTSPSDRGVYDQESDGTESDWAAEAARIGATGAAGAGAGAAAATAAAGAATRDDDGDRAYEDSAYEDSTYRDDAVREGDAAPVQADGDASYTETIAADGDASSEGGATYEGEPTYTDDQAFAAPTHDADLDGQPAEEPYQPGTYEAEDVQGARDEDDDWLRQAAAIGATGAAGAGAVAATHDDDTFRDDAVRDDAVRDEPVREDAYAAHDAGGSDIEPLTADEVDAGASGEPLPLEGQETYDAPAQESYDAPVEETYDAPVEETYEAERGAQDDDQSYWREAATIGAASAAGTGAAAATRDDERPSEDEAIAQETAEDSTAYADPTYATQGSTAQDGPLTADEVLAADDAQDTQGTTYTADPAHTDGARTDETPMGEPTTYRADDGDAVAVDDPVSYDDRTDGVGTDGVGTTEFAEAAYGAGSVEPAEDGSGPAGWEVKGNAGSMLFHTPESPSYDAVRAEVWFESEDAARAAGFAHWDRRRR
ncbi:sunset domain-containing protein [Ornithinimicrobium panacihumi]|uniref:sunset domain-containing protein n=1 Tax=Ornithinimicrobium panacihumi TaxID=2008449 RepID=UPI003F8A129D